jgi:hypothetical protein
MPVKKFARGAPICSPAIRSTVGMSNATIEHSQSGGSKRQQGSGQRGGSGNFADDPVRASEAGRKGGQR